MPVLRRTELEESPLSDLHAIASELGIEGYRLLRREKLIESILGGGGGEEPSAPKSDAAKPEEREER